MEVTAEGRAWFIDAWAVRDGAAFASFRHRNALDATNTVFVAVPALQPTPVGRITTALGATRYCFQDRLHDDFQTEIAFDSLAQIQELVRRAYIASGIGPGGTAGPVAALPGPEPGGPGGTYYEQTVEHHEDAVAEASPEDRRSFLAPSVRFEPLRTPRTLSMLGDLVEQYAKATILEWEHALPRIEEQRQRQHAEAALKEWYLLLLSRGIWRSPYSFVDFVEGRDCDHGLKLAYRFGIVDGPQAEWPVWIVPSATAARQFSDQQVLQTAPAALRASWDPSITRLTDKMFLAISDVTYFEFNPELPELAPALLASLVSRPRGGWFDILAGSTDQTQAVTEALDWLERELPSVPLPPAAEEMLTRYAWEQLTGPALQP